MPTIHVLIVADASGSMGPYADDVRAGFNQMIDDLKAAKTPDEAGDRNLIREGDTVRVTFVQFNDKVTTVCADVDIEHIPHLDEDSYVPSGMTALLAAVGRTVDRFERRHPELPADDKVLLVIETDGAENWSHRYDDGYDWDRVSKMLVDRQERGWVIAYMGATADAWRQGGRLGLREGSIIRTAHSSAGYAASYAAVAGSTVALSRGAVAADILRDAAKIAGEA